jgi:hypothetical protein
LVPFGVNLVNPPLLSLLYNCFSLFLVFLSVNTVIDVVSSLYYLTFIDF